MQNPRIANVHLIVGGEVHTRSGPRPLSPKQAALETERRISIARFLARKEPTRNIDEHEQKMEALRRLGHVFELVALQWLTSQGFNFSPHRSLFFRRLVEGKWETEVCELDGVVLDDNGKIKTIVEVRVSTMGMYAVYEKRTQLRKSLEVARTLNPDVTGLIVFIRIGDQVLPEEELVRTTPRSLLRGKRFNLKRLPNAWKHTELPVIAIPFDVIWEYAKANGWTLEPTLQHLAKQYALERYLRRSLKYQERMKQWNDIDLGTMQISDSQEIA